ncbi:MAG: LPS assembly protein LptD [Pseudomonadota bacterium]
MTTDRLIARLCLSTVLSGAAGAAWAQDNAIYAEPSPNPLAQFVDLDEEPEEAAILFEADSVSREIDGGPITAEGDVSAFFGERYLRADRLIYDPATDIVYAEGDVAITDENLETAFAGRVEITGDLRDGIVENFSALLAENARLAADSAVREQGARTRLNRAVYTACNVCDDDGEAKTPTWRVKSLRVVRDEERKVVRFYHAFFEIKGVPVFYVPFLQGPDPSVERQSGFLAPSIGASSRLGFNLELPYYLAISNSQDATFSPKYTTNDGVLWQGEYRRRGKKSYHVLAGGVINYDNRVTDDAGRREDENGIPGVRWHYFGEGYKDVGDHWRLSYDLERISDREYLRQYDVEREGDLRQELDRSRTNRLRSNARAQWRRNGHNLTIDSYVFQGLRATDDASSTPYVLPSFDYRYDFSRRLAGGRTSINANTTFLLRTGGTDTQRFTASAYWERDIITRGGHRFNLFAEARADAYYFTDLDQGTEICSDSAADCAADFPGLTSDDTSTFETRLAPSIGLEWSYPLYNNIGGVGVFIEPRIQAVASPARQNPLEIINEDSQSIEFDYAGLFDYNKATGYDTFEDGQRINVGVAATAEFPFGLTVEGSAGQQFRLQTTNAFSPSSGLGDTQSDIVGSLNVKYKEIVGVENRFRIDNDTGSIQRAESMARFSLGPVLGNLTYVRLNEENIAAALVRREELTALGRIKITDHWSLGGAWRIDLEQDRTIRQDFIVGYQDECMTVALTYRRDRTEDDNLEPDNAFLVSFTLRSLVD